MKRKSDCETEKILIRRSREGDLEALEELIDTYGRRVYSVSFQILGNHADAEDMLQEAFIKAYRNLKTFRGGSTSLLPGCIESWSISALITGKNGEANIVLPPEIDSGLR